jgi:hypothetical protein
MIGVVLKWTSVIIIKKMPKPANHRKIRLLHTLLLTDLENFRRKLPENVDEISEAYERYVRIIALLIQTLEKLLRIETQDKLNNRTANDAKTRREILSKIERRLAHVADEKGSEESS